MRQRLQPPGDVREPMEKADHCFGGDLGHSAWLESVAVGVEEHLAIDEALLEEAHEGLRYERVVRTWMADETVVIVGSSSRIETEVDLAACRSRGVRVVRRPSGGATVVIGPGCLMWSVVTPFPRGAPAVDTLHSASLNPLLESLAADGLPVRRAGTSDLALGDRKVSGNALRIRRHAVLYHGTLLDSFDLRLVQELLRHPPREPAYRGGRPHTTFLTNLDVGRERLEHLVRRAFAAATVARPYDISRVERLLNTRYRCETWHGRL